MRFDEFIMERMGYPWGENEPDKQTRRRAFLVFRQRTGRVDFASLPTMHRWLELMGITNRAGTTFSKWHLPWGLTGRRRSPVFDGGNR